MFREPLKGAGDEWSSPDGEPHTQCRIHSATHPDLLTSPTSHVVPPTLISPYVLAPSYTVLSFPSIPPAWRVVSAHHCDHPSALGRHSRLLELRPGASHLSTRTLSKYHPL